MLTPKVQTVIDYIGHGHVWSHYPWSCFVYCSTVPCICSVIVQERAGTRIMDSHESGLSLDNMPLHC